MIGTGGPNLAPFTGMNWTGSTEFDDSSTTAVESFGKG
jgi:hypothetical protein